MYNISYIIYIAAEKPFSGSVINICYIYTVYTVYDFLQNKNK